MAKSVQQIFASVNPGKIATNLGLGGRGWTPPADEYVGFAVKRVLDEQGMKWVDKKTNQQMVRPKLTFFFEISSGPFAGKQFQDEDFILSDEPPQNEKQQKARDSELGRLKGILEVVTGQEVTEETGGFFGHMALFDARLEEYGGRVPLKFKVEHYKPNPSPTKANPRLKVSVYAQEAWDGETLPDETVS